MTIEQIIALTQAGFSKYDILEMVSQNQMQMPTQQMPTQQMPTQQMPTQQMQTQQMPIQMPTQQMPMQQMQTQQMPIQMPTQQMPMQQMNTGFYSNSNYPQNINQQSQQIGEQNDVLSALKNLTRSVQNNNINMMQNQIPKQVTTEDAIASIINPPNYEGLTDGGSK